jgi:hypothetical protein
MKRFALPLAWVALAVLIIAHAAISWALLNWALAHPAPQDFAGGHRVVAQWNSNLSVVAACLVFAVVYAFLPLTTVLQRRLAWTHLLASVIGYLLIFGPCSVVPLIFRTPERFEDVQGAFELLNRVSSVGNFVGLLGLLIFIGLLGDAAARGLRRTPG